MGFLQPQLVQIPMRGGLADDVDPKQVLAGNLTEASNIVFDKQGRISKRYGFDALPVTTNGDNMTVCAALGTYRDELLAFDGDLVHTWGPTDAVWQERGVAVSCVIDSKQIVRQSGNQQLNPDVAYLAGVEVYAWEDASGGIRYACQDTTTGAFYVVNAEVSATGVQPRVLPFHHAGKILILYVESANLKVKTITPSAPTTLSSATTLKADYVSGYAYDAVVDSSNQLLQVAYAATGDIVRLFSCSTGLSVVTTTTVQSGTAQYAGGYSVHIDSSGRVWVAWSEGDNGAGGRLRYAVLTSAHVSVLAATTIATYATGVPVIEVGGVSFESDATTSLIVAGVTISGGYQTTVYTATAAGSVATIREMLNVRPASKPWTTGGERFYISLARQSTLQSTYYIAQLLTASTFITYMPIVGRYSVNSGGGYRTRRLLGGVSLIETGVYRLAGLQKGRLISEANVVVTVLGVTGVTVDLAHSNRFIGVEAGGSLLFVGGYPQMYDGAGVTEIGFAHDPEGVTLQAAGVDGFLDPGDYQYCVCYEWTDNLGQIHRSAPSVPTSVTVGATNHVTVTVPTQAQTAKRTTFRTPIDIVIYRTDVGPGTIFRRVTSILAPTRNVHTSVSVSFNDVTSDANIASNEVLYTTGGVLANASPPACSLMTTYQGRVILGGLEDPNLLWFSKRRFDNTNASTIPFEFAAELTIACDPEGGDITALGALDDKLVIFKESSIYVTNGEGPNDTGGGEPFPDPQRVSADVGCSTPNSVVVTPLGLMFQSQRGIHLLGRDLQLSYIGAAVESFNSEEILASALFPKDGQVLFVTTNRIIVYDLANGQWSTWSITDGVDVAVSRGLLFLAKAAADASSNVVFQQNRSAWADHLTPVTMSFTTPPLQFASMNGHQRVIWARFLGQYKSAHTLTASVWYDHAGGVAEDTAAYTPSQSADTPEEFRINFQRQRCSAVKVRFVESQESAGEGLNVSGLQFWVGVLPGGNRLPSANIVGAS